MRRDFIPMGSEQPVVFEYTVNGEPRRTGGERERATVEEKGREEERRQ